MIRILFLVSITMLGMATLSATAMERLAASEAASTAVVACATDASVQEMLAAKEVRRYVYLRTGVLLPMEQKSALPDGIDAVVLANKDRAIVGTLASAPGLKQALAALGPQQYLLRTVLRQDHRILLVVGGDGIGTLYGAYRLAEHLGVRFFLHGDVVPDQRVAWNLPELNDVGKPLFALRGVNPWGSHPFGFDAWSADDYKAVFAQLAKMRMNFLGVHCYPEGRPYAEPTVWHGLGGDFDEQGRVKISYISRYFNTLLTPAWGDFHPRKTADYHFGGGLLFERDDWAPPVLAGHCPLPTTPDACNAVFNRMAAQFRDAFAFARQVGVKTCIGSETPLAIPQTVRNRLKAQGKSSEDRTAVREVYEGTFRRIMASHPLDYYWIWTPESWTWEGNRPEQYQAAVADIKLAAEAMEITKAPFKLATAGWVLGPASDRAAFDNDLPKDVPMSAISRGLGHSEVDPAFGRIAGREKWAIPWLESDAHQGLAGVQLYAGRMRRDAADAAEYGCTGLLGLHWRTDILSPNASALAQAAWNQSWKPASAAAWQMGGSNADYPNAKISGTADEALYRSCRYDLRTIAMKVPNGKHKVTLKFCEPHFKASGERVFDVRLQNRTVVENLDIFARVGPFAALDFSFDDVAVSGGDLKIELVARKSLPCISAIAVESPGFGCRINCGGGEYKDWLAGNAASPRCLPCDDFYADWALVQFGPEAADGIAKVFTNIDGKVPLATADGCPVGPLNPDTTPWATIAARFAFVDVLEKLRPSVRGAGNLDRFDYWLSTFKYYRSLAQVRCALGAKAAPGEVTRLWGDTYRYLLESVNTPGAMAMVVTMENHPGWGPLVAPRASQPWPTEYAGARRIIVPTLRGSLALGETLALKVLVLSTAAPREAVVHWREMGHGRFEKTPLRHVASGVYEVRFPPEGAKTDLEYYLEARWADGPSARFPVTAPALNQTLVGFATE